MRPLLLCVSVAALYGCCLLPAAAAAAILSKRLRGNSHRSCRPFIPAAAAACLGGAVRTRGAGSDQGHFTSGCGAALAGRTCMRTARWLAMCARPGSAVPIAKFVFARLALRTAARQTLLGTPLFSFRVRPARRRPRVCSRSPRTPAAGGVLLSSARAGLGCGVHSAVRGLVRARLLPALHAPCRSRHWACFPVRSVRCAGSARAVAQVSVARLRVCRRQAARERSAPPPAVRCPHAGTSGTAVQGPRSRRTAARSDPASRRRSGQALCERVGVAGRGVAARGGRQARGAARGRASRRRCGHEATRMCGDEDTVAACGEERKRAERLRTTRKRDQLSDA
ncbi:hypothetical protein ERJ75_001318100 [Trypanosoma vivax]|nr:hypothetical protein ERJ75_001318100 [Trypanosoma vivax]